MSALRLVIFDIDGTLVDSQAEIVAAMRIAHEDTGFPLPSRALILSIVGLSLPQAFATLHPGANAAEIGALTERYKAAFLHLRSGPGAPEAPLFDGMREILDALAAEPWTLLGVATGKSRRGLDRLLARHGLADHFHTTQVADDHPSKPAPSMILTALRECGVTPAQAVMIGDTTFDMQMAKAAAVESIGVAWGYHDVADLGADRVVATAAELWDALTESVSA